MHLMARLDVCGFLLGVCGAGGRDPSVRSVVSQHRVHLVVPDHHRPVGGDALPGKEEGESRFLNAGDLVCMGLV